MAGLKRHGHPNTTGACDYLKKKRTGFKFHTRNINLKCTGEGEKKRKQKENTRPCMDMEGATEATGIGGMDTPPKEL